MSWTGYGSNNSSYKLELTVTESSFSTPNNSSVVSIVLKFITGIANFDGWTNTWSCDVNGTTYSGSFRSCSPNSTKTLVDTTLTVAHNDDGSKTISCAASSSNSDDYNYLPGSMTCGGNLTLTEIARASSISASSAITVSDTTGTLSYTATSKADYYHKLSWAYGTNSTSIWTAEHINTTTKSGTINYSDILNKVNNTKSGSIVFSLSTYSDSACTTQIGSTQTVSCLVSIDSSTIKPTISLGSISVNSSSIANYLIAGFSTAKSTYTITNSYGASSATAYYSISKGSLTNANNTSLTGTIYTNNLPSSESDYTFTISAYAVDSRGAISSTVTVTSGTVYGYQIPAITSSIYRANNNSTVQDDGAAYVYVSFSSAVSSSVNNQNTIQSTVCTYGEQTATTGTWIALSESASQTFIVTATDNVSSATKTTYITVGVFPIDLYDDGSGTIGVGLATVAEGGCVKSNLPIKVVNPTDTTKSSTIETSSDGMVITADSLSTPSLTASGVSTTTLSASGITTLSDYLILNSGIKFLYNGTTYTITPEMLANIVYAMKGGS